MSRKERIKELELELAQRNEEEKEKKREEELKNKLFEKSLVGKGLKGLKKMIR